MRGGELELVIVMRLQCGICYEVKRNITVREVKKIIRINGRGLLRTETFTWRKVWCSSDMNGTWLQLMRSCALHCNRISSSDFKKTNNNRNSEEFETWEGTRERRIQVWVDIWTAEYKRSTTVYILGVWRNCNREK